MKVRQLLTYPIKSLRASAIQEGLLTQNGFPYDRRLMLCKIKEDGSHENMHISRFAQMGLFLTDIVVPDPADVSSAHIVVTYSPPAGAAGAGSTLNVPLVPSTAALATIDIMMHESGTKAYKMHQSYSDWFSSHFGFTVVLVYLGSSLREVLCSNPANPATNSNSGSSWLSSISANIPLIGATTKSKDRITFADCVPYLVVSQTSLENVSRRLPDGEDMDITKFRPNIVVEGAQEEWEEDYWAEIQIGDAKIITAHNCVRCTSINVDYSTGKPGTGESGTVLKKLQKDRRVDPAVKYSPVFGRYSFLGAGSEGKTIRVGDEVTVLKKNSERTRFDWECLTK